MIFPHDGVIALPVNVKNIDRPFGSRRTLFRKTDDPALHKFVVVDFSFFFIDECQVSFFQMGQDPASFFL
jgi:hypothetical protein